MKRLQKVLLNSDVYAVCLQHALTTEKEEIMGMLIGETNEETQVSHISACVILHRSDKQPDRVEISPEQLCNASIYASELSEQLGRPMRVVGWYHSHPHITVWPSHVDVRTQSMYQTMDPLFIGLIFSVYQSDSGSTGNKVQLICFQAIQQGSEWVRREVELEITKSPLEKHNLLGIAELSKILTQEEVSTFEAKSDKNETDELSILHNDAIKTLALVHIVSKVTKPFCEDLEERLKATTLRIKEMENYKKEILNKCH